MTRSMVCWLPFLMVLASVGQASAQEIQAGPLTLDLTGRAQLQFSTTSVDHLTDLPVDGPLDEAVPATAFEVRRIRFGTNFVFDEWITGSIEADFAGGTARLTNGYVDLGFADALAVRAGQFKKPFGLFELTSSTKILTIERAARLRGLEPYLGRAPSDAQTLLDEGGYIGRDIGVEVFGDVGPVTYAAGVFNGSGANAKESSDSKAIAARVGATIVEGLVAGVAMSDHPLAGTAWSLDAEIGGFREPGLHLMAEVMRGDNGRSPATGSELTMTGAQVAGAWFAPVRGRVEGIEPVLRVSWGDPDVYQDADDGMLVTPGLNLYFTGRNRLMVNGEFYVPGQAGKERQFGLVTQLQVYF